MFRNPIALLVDRFSDRASGRFLKLSAEIGIDVTQALIGLRPLRCEKRVQAMGCIMLLSALVVRAAIVAALLVFSSTEARAQNPRLADANAGHKPFPPIYDPYPSGILPSDLDSEMERVRREVRGIFNQGVKEWRALHIICPWRAARAVDSLRSSLPVNGDWFPASARSLVREPYARSQDVLS